jgi:amino acid permease
MRAIPRRDLAWCVVAGIAGGCVGVLLAWKLPGILGVDDEQGATASTFDTAAVTVLGLGLGVALSACIGVLLSPRADQLKGGLISAGVAFLFVVAPAVFAAKLETDRVSRIFDLPFIALGIAPVVAAGVGVGLGVSALRTGSQQEHHP